MAAYYNEFDPYAAQWLRNLIAAGHIAAGDVDERSITEVKSDEIKGYTQCHFFAGIGGWSYALRLAGWDDTRPVWTGSCPCQPFSTAGKQKGHSDERHLWPHWFRLIRECKPTTIFGEQVAAAITFGWLDEAFNDLENEAYACAAAVLPACSIGRPHKRDRVWFVADADSGDAAGRRRVCTSQCEVNFGGEEREKERSDNADNTQRPSGGDFSWLECPDGKYRPIKPEICLLANGVPARVGRLRAYGNAIVPQVAAEFIKVIM